jgi:uncharacterized membrane protein
MAYTDGPEITRPAKVRFDVLNEGWNLFSKQMAPWVVAVLIVLAVQLLIGGILRVPLMALMLSDKGQSNSPSPLVFVFSGVAAIVQGIIGSVLGGGLFKMALRQLRGEIISPGDIFGAMDKLGPLAVAGFLIGLGVTIGTYLCILPGVILGGLWMFAIPLIIDKNLGPTEAMGASMNALKPELPMAALFVFVAGLIYTVGAALTCTIGILFLVPMLLLAVTRLYRDFFPEPLSEG